MRQMDYAELAQRLLALVAGECDQIALMATIACEVHHFDKRFDWTGFYRVVSPGVLKIGPYQGGHGCLEIPFERGVCGAAARSGEIQRVDDVRSFPGHISCSSTTRSELVLPVRDGSGRLVAVFDIDSDRPAAFTTGDAEKLDGILRKVFARR